MNAPVSGAGCGRHTDAEPHKSNFRSEVKPFLARTAGGASDSAPGLSHHVQSVNYPLSSQAGLAGSARNADAGAVSRLSIQQLVFVHEGQRWRFVRKERAS